mmetsp:Transcript_13628/g.24344  ORF Transcript_13628/g.24344 Transcript_13628/m.24344 type:complete len:108 (-) Transcript_13628:27-350(-)
MFAHLHDDAKTLHAAKYQSAQTNNPLMGVQDFLQYLLPDGLRMWSLERSKFAHLADSSPLIQSGDGRNRRTEDIFLAGHGLYESQGFVSDKKKVLCLAYPKPKSGNQ